LTCDRSILQIRNCLRTLGQYGDGGISAEAMDFIRGKPTIALP
jgi:hypothetical protein